MIACLLFLLPCPKGFWASRRFVVLAITPRFCVTVQNHLQVAFTHDFLSAPNLKPAWQAQTAAAPDFLQIWRHPPFSLVSQAWIFMHDFLSAPNLNPAWQAQIAAAPDFLQIWLHPPFASVSQTWSFTQVFLSAASLNPFLHAHMACLPSLKQYCWQPPLAFVSQGCGISLQILTNRDLAIEPIASKFLTWRTLSPLPAISSRPLRSMSFPIPTANTLAPCCSQALVAAGTLSASLASPSVKTMQTLAVALSLRDSLV